VSAIDPAAQREVAHACFAWRSCIIEGYASRYGEELMKVLSTIAGLPQHLMREKAGKGRRLSSGAISVLFEFLQAFCIIILAKLMIISHVLRYQLGIRANR
jgi:hypothetical protein